MRCVEKILYTLGLKRFGRGGFCYEVKCLNEGGRVATPTRFSIFDSYVMKSYLHWIQNAVLKFGMLVFQVSYEMKLKTSKFQVLAF